MKATLERKNGEYLVSVDGKVIGSVRRTKSYWTAELKKDGLWYTAHGIVTNTRKEAIEKVLMDAKLNNIF